MRNTRRRRCPGNGIVAHGGMNGHIGGFVDYEKIFVFVDDIQRERDGWNFGGGNHLANMYGQKISGAQAGDHEGGNAVDQNAFWHFFQVREIGGRISPVFQKLRNAKPAFRRAYRISENSFHKKTCRMEKAASSGLSENCLRCRTVPFYSDLTSFHISL